MAPDDQSPNLFWLELATEALQRRWMVCAQAGPLVGHGHTCPTATRGSPALQDEFGGHIPRAWAKGTGGRDGARRRVGRVTLLFQRVRWAQQRSAPANPPFFSRPHLQTTQAASPSLAEGARSSKPSTGTPARHCPRPHGDTWGAGAGRGSTKTPLAQHFTEL